MPRQSRYDEAAEAWDGPSKTQQKQAAHEQQDLGVELLKLSAATLDSFGLHERLREALREHGRMPTREARRRHLQFIARVLRESDSEDQVRAALKTLRAGEARLLAEAEAWRERLLADDAALTDWIKAHPAAEVQPLRGLIRNARKEIATAQDADPAAARGKSRAFRDLFQALRGGLKLAQQGRIEAADPADADDPGTGSDSDPTGPDGT